MFLRVEKLQPAFNLSLRFPVHKNVFSFCSAVQDLLQVFFGPPVSSLSSQQRRPILWWAALVKCEQLIEVSDYFPVLSTCEAAFGAMCHGLDSLLGDRYWENGVSPTQCVIK